MACSTPSIELVAKLEALAARQELDLFIFTECVGRGGRRARDHDAFRGRFPGIGAAQEGSWCSSNSADLGKGESAHTAAESEHEESDDGEEDGEG